MPGFTTIRRGPNTDYYNSIGLRLVGIHWLNSIHLGGFSEVFSCITAHTTT